MYVPKQEFGNEMKAERIGLVTGSSSANRAGDEGI